MGTIKRLYVEKKREYDTEARKYYTDLKQNVGILNLENLRLLKRYDVSGLTEEEYLNVKTTILSEPPVDSIYDEILPADPDEKIIAVEYLPGQFDQRADSASQCIQIMTLKKRPLVLSANIFVFRGDISREQMNQIKNYLINPVDSREAHAKKPTTLEMDFSPPPPIQKIGDFRSKNREEMEELRVRLELAMSSDDFLFCQDYFKNRCHRDPFITEIKMLDTYWSDHCRHTTFNTRIKNVQLKEGPFSHPIEQAYRDLKKTFAFTGLDPDRDMSLMNIATLSVREMKKRGLLEDLEESGEINACSIIREISTGNKREKWLIMFKNETHNHPTEIEPFGGAATCLGGAIRDPLSGRSFVYQAMRVTGCADPRTAIQDTLPGKLPQRKITREAAHGYSSYGNQIGLATGQVVEIYHPGYMAKRMEVGAVIGAVPQKNVIRKEPDPGDVILLIGGRTGRDGIGGATGSSKEHTEASIHTASAEVQKGNAPEERKLQRLFRNSEACLLIKKCNDFGAGGVSVAVGELADGVDIQLDRIPKKYQGLDGTELALSESQERMAVVAAPENVEKLSRLAREENLEATVIATVTAEKRLKMFWRDQTIVDIHREFIDTNGVRQTTGVEVVTPSEKKSYFQTAVTSAGSGRDIEDDWMANLQDLNVCRQQGLVERFDHSIGARSVLMSQGGRTQETPVEAMVAKIPVYEGEPDQGTVMGFGFNPDISSWSPFHGAVYAVIESVAKIVATGGAYQTIRLSMQEYFEKLGNNKSRWGKPFGALLGAQHVMSQLGIPSIGGKDSMSGSFKDLDVPPTLIAFGVTTLELKHVVSPEFKKTGSTVITIKLNRDRYEMPDLTQFKKICDWIHDGIRKQKILSAQTVRTGGIAAAISKMALGNQIGFKFSGSPDPTSLFSPDYGSFILEMAEGFEPETIDKSIGCTVLGKTTEEPAIASGSFSIPLPDIFRHWKSPLEKTFPTGTDQKNTAVQIPEFTERAAVRPAATIARPRVVIPIFPGTNCEYDTDMTFTKFGAEVTQLVFRNLTPTDIEESINLLKETVNNSQIIVIPGGFSSGDEPDGSGKFIAAVFRNPGIQEAVMNLLQNRDGLILGICNGFQALIKLGLVPFGEIRELTEESPTITFNTIGRHMSRVTRTRVASTLSPWYMHSETGEIHLAPISHGEGRFVADEKLIRELAQNGQIATQYVNIEGRPTMTFPDNPNGSEYAIEGITSPDGRILGKMAHPERIAPHVGKNIPELKEHPIFKAGVDYFL